MVSINPFRLAYSLSENSLMDEELAIFDRDNLRS